MDPQKTTVDWLRFRVKGEPKEVIEAMRPMFGSSGEYLNFGDPDRGVLGFSESRRIFLGKHTQLGRLDFGGDAQRGWIRVDVGGQGCQWVTDWDALQDVEALPEAQLRRLDIALTTWEGQVSHEAVVKAHSDGRFVTKGRPPALQQIISSDPRAGRTCYIGKRQGSPKFLRCYEKGLEMAAKFPGQVEKIDGKRVEDIYRVELELKAEAADIPWEAVERRDQFFAGSYPFCADLLPGVEADILMRRPERAPQTELAAALANCRFQFGRTLFTALAAHGGDYLAVWDQIVGDQHCDRLLQAGVLMVDH